MKKIIECEDKDGLVGLLGETITVFCMNYFYTGKLVGVNETCIKLENPKIIYETGGFGEVEWKDAQALPKKYWYVQISSIESFGEMK